MLLPIHKEALDMIVHKIGRILNGNPNYIDSFRDIAGYAELVVNYLKELDGAADSKSIQMERVNGNWKEVEKQFRD